MSPDVEEELTTVRDHSARYAFAARLASGKTVLDLGCGAGYGDALLLAQGAGRVVGCDISAATVEAARRHYGTRVRFVRMDAQRVGFADRAFDVIVSFETIEHVADPRAFLVEANRVLKAEGFFICSTPNRWYGPTDTISPYHVREFSADDLRAMLSEVFKSVELYGQGEYTEASRIRLRMLLTLKRFAQPLRRRASGLYERLQHLYNAYASRAASRRPRIRLDGISLDELDRLSHEGNAPSALSQVAGTPRVIVAIARK